MSENVLENFKDKVILVTGGTGFIGASFISYLLNAGVENIHVTVRKESNLVRLSGFATNIRSHLIQGSSTLYHTIVNIEPDFIFHFAFPELDKSDTLIGKTRNAQENVRMDFELLEGAKECNLSCLFIAGSSLVYSDEGDMLRPDGIIAPINLKGVLKRNSELMCSYYRSRYRVPVRIGRIFRCYGPLEQDDRLIKTAIRNNISRHPMPISNSAYSRDYIYIDDLLEGLIRFISLPETPFILNFGGGVSYTSKDVCNTISQITGIEMQYSVLEFNNSVADRQISKADISETCSYLNWQPTVSLEEGLRKIIEHIDD